MEFIGFLIMGLIVGALARLVVPGRDPMGIIGTMLLGIVGAFLGGLAAAAFGDNDGVGFLGAFVGAVVVLLIYRSVSKEKPVT